MGTLKFYVYHSYDARFPQLIQLFVTLWTVGRQAPVDGIFRIVHLNSFFFFYNESSINLNFMGKWVSVVPSYHTYYDEHSSFICLTPS